MTIQKVGVQTMSSSPMLPPHHQTVTDSTCTHPPPKTLLPIVSTGPIGAQSGMRAPFRTITA